MTFFYNDIPSQDEHFKKHKIGWIRYIVINLKPNQTFPVCGIQRCEAKGRKMLILFHNFGIYVFLSFSFSNADSLLLVDYSF